MDELQAIITMVTNSGLAMGLCVYYTISFSKQMNNVVNQLSLLTDKMEQIISK